MRGVLAGLGLLLALSGCAGIEQAAKEGAQEGAVEGAMETLGQVVIETAAGVKLDGELACVAKPASGGGHDVDCSGQTKDGKKASANGNVTSVDLTKGVVRGKLTFTFDGKELTKMDCLGNC